jgi:DNA-binding NtrC family response regulator
MGYSFPGNVRELKSLIELAVTLSENDEIEPVDLVIDRDDPLTDIASEVLTLREYEIKIIKATLKRNNNNIKAAADKLDIGISTIYRVLKEEKE